MTTVSLACQDRFYRDIHVILPLELEANDLSKIPVVENIILSNKYFLINPNISTYTCLSLNSYEYP